jgi:DNA polymerase-3 subunit gamma/tau
MVKHISFYRKWRPQDFEEIIGQDYLVKTLKNAVSRNRLTHAYIFCGPRGTGKTSTARIFAKALNCVDGPTSKPCNKCDNCKSIMEGSSVDVIEIDAASNRGIEEIRELRDKAKYLPTKLRKKVYIIDEVHMLTTHAFNALLKVLEEPPEHVVFILATTEPNMVIPTIMSRCQRFDFRPVSVSDITKRLKSISVQENIEISGPAIDMIAKYSDGSLRDADGMLEQLSSFSDGEIKTEEVTHLFGLVDFDVLFEMTDILIEKNINQAVLFSDRLIKSIQNLSLFVTEFIEHLYNLYVIKNYDEPFDVIDLSEDHRERMIRQAKQLSSEDIEYFIDLFSELHQKIKWGEGYRTFFKTYIIKAIKHDFIENQEISERLDLLKRELDKINNIDTKKERPLNKPQKEIKPKIIEEKEVAEKEKITKKVKDSSSEIIKENWDDINIALKKKNISINAMFIEVKSYLLNKDKLTFYLDKSKKWHKDHLNKSKNINTITDIIESKTGKKYKISFEFEDENTKSDAINLKKNNNTLHTEDDKTEEIKYLEEKFGIKKE